MFGWLWPHSDTSLTHYGQIGDYVGGLWGTVISIAALIIIFFTWRSSRKSEIRSSIISVLAEMLKTHDAISVSAENNFYSRKGTPSILLREFAAIYRITNKAVPGEKWSIDDRIDIAYTFAFFGLTMQAGQSLKRHGPEDIKTVQDHSAKLRDRVETKYHGLFKGHQTSIPHYLRNLFSMYMLIESSKLREYDKINFSKIIKSKMSNYDQGLLALNIISHLGRDWESEGLVEKYKPFSNIPKHFFGFDNKFSIKDRFPNVLFEWENAEGIRPRYMRARLGEFSLTLTRYPVLEKP